MEGIRFLHVGDIHLGCRQYNHPEREDDFYEAFDSILTRYALPTTPEGEAQVDFVLIAGDLFDSRNINPNTLSRAVRALATLRDYGIQVFAIEGNHDQKRRDELASWYDYLNDQELLFYLRDFQEDGELVLLPWDEEEGYGSYYDIPDTGIRIVGSRWYGATAHNMLERFPDVLASLPPADFTIMMFHGGLTDYVNELSAGVEYEQFLKLRPHLDYLALGHIHMEYQRQQWLFNPGSPEATKLDEYHKVRGAYRVTLGSNGIETLEHCTSYRHRPFITMALDCDIYTTPEELAEASKSVVDKQGQAALEAIQRKWPTDIVPVPPVCHLSFLGSLGFPFSQIPIKEIESYAKQELGAFLFRFRNDTRPLDYGLEDEYPEKDGRLDRQQLERQVFHNLIEQDTRYRPHAEAITSYAIGLKQRLLGGSLRDEELQHMADRLYELLHQNPSEVMQPKTPAQESTHEASTSKESSVSSSEHVAQENTSPPTDSMDISQDSDAHLATLCTDSESASSSSEL